MALEEEMMEEEEVQGVEGERVMDEDEEMSLEIAVLLGKHLIEDGDGASIIESAKKSSDPGQVIGQFLLQLGSQMAEQMPGDIELPPSIFLAKGGWLEQMSDFIEEEYDVSRKIMDRAEIYVATTGQQMAQAQAQKAQAPQMQGMAAEPAPAPQGGMV